MDESQLPLEIFLLIFQHLAPIDTWQYQIVSRAWHSALSSSVAVTSALTDRLDVEHFRNHHLSRPVSLVSIVPEDHYKVSNLAFTGCCLAYLRYAVRPRSWSQKDLVIHNLDCDTIRTVYIEACVQSKLVIGDVLAFHDRHTLYTVSKDGETGARQMPGEVAGPIAIEKSTIAMLPDLGIHRNCVGPRSYTEPEIVYVYDYANDIFEVKQLSALRPSYTRQRGLLMSDDDILIISIDAPDYHSKPVQYVISVRSVKGRNWSATYSVLGDDHWSWAQLECSISPTWNGVNYDVIVHDSPRHNITITLDGFVSCQDFSYQARWFDDVYDIVEFGVESKTGFICHELPYTLQYCRRDPSLQVNEQYLKEEVENPDHGIRGIHIFRFGGAIQHWSSNMIWENREADRVA